MKIMKIFLLFFISLFSKAILAEDNLGAAHPWGLNLREPFSPFMADSVAFHDVLMWLITAISLFVLLLIFIIVFKFNKKANPKPSKTTHNTFIEIAWTVVPVLILVIMAVPSFKLLYKGDVVPEAHMTIKAIGHQWYWTYEYPDHGNFTYDAWAVPSLGVKKDTVPGRLNETWFEATREGIFYGQCSELCGQMHGFMPIEVHAVSEEEFLKWIEETKLKPDVYEYADSNEDKQIQLVSKINK